MSDAEWTIEGDLETIRMESTDRGGRRVVREWPLRTAYEDALAYYSVAPDDSRTLALTVRHLWEENRRLSALVDGATSSLARSNEVIMGLVEEMREGME